MTELQKEYCEEKGIQFVNVWITKETVDYTNWLEEKLQALRIHDVSVAGCGWCGNKLCDSQKFNNTCFKCGKSPYSKQTER
jgi:hypothetical protein